MCIKKETRTDQTFFFEATGEGGLQKRVPDRTGLGKIALVSFLRVGVCGLMRTQSTRDI